MASVYFGVSEMLDFVSNINRRDLLDGDWVGYENELRCMYALS